LPLSNLPLGFLLADAHRLYRRRFEKAATATDLGLTTGEARTLAYANAFPGLRQSALAERMTLVAFLDGLEAKGLVVREPDPTDRRCKRITTTAGAAEAARAIGEAGLTVRESVCRGFSDAEIETLRDLLARLTNNLATVEA